MSDEPDVKGDSVPTSNLTAPAVNAAPPPKKRIIVSIAVKRPQPAEQQKRINRGQLLGAAIALAGGFGFWVNDLIVASGHALVHWDVPLVFSLALVLAVDAFLVLLLNTVISRGSTGAEPFPMIPDRGPAALLLGFLYLALIGSFAHLNFATGLTNADNTLYEAFLTVATLEHSHYAVEGHPALQALVAFEIASVVLLFFVFFPMLVGRLAVFKGDVTTEDQLKAFCQPGKPIDPRPAFSLSADEDVEWRLVPEATATVPASPATVVNVSEWGEVTLKNSAR
jgi:hypothetical protein